MTHNELEFSRQHVREASMNLLSAAVGRAVGLYEERDTASSEITITKESWEQFERFCKIVRSKKERARACDRDHIVRAREGDVHGDYCRVCHAGVHNFRVERVAPGRRLVLIGGEYQITDDALLMRESERNFEQFLQRFQIGETERRTLEEARAEIQPISRKELALKLSAIEPTLLACLEVLNAFDRIEKVLARQRLKIAHEFATLLDPIQSEIRYLLDKGDANERYRMAGEREALYSLADYATQLFDAIATNIPEYYDFKFAPKNENIEALIRAAANIFRKQAERRGIVIRVELEHDERARSVQVSRRHFQSVLRNLIDNAVKYSFRTIHGGRQREVIITGRALPTDYEIMIENYGTGIDPDELPHVFEVGFQGRRKQNEHVTGAGFGLSMVHRFVMMHHGKIYVTSMPMGAPTDPSPSLPFLTRFHVTLPYTQPSKSRSQIEENVYVKTVES